jgi:hypothetical protein
LWRVTQFKSLKSATISVPSSTSNEKEPEMPPAVEVPDGKETGRLPGKWEVAVKLAGL